MNTPAAALALSLIANSGARDQDSAAGEPEPNRATQTVGAGKPVNSLFGMLSCPVRVTRDHPALLGHPLYQGQATPPEDQLCSTDRYYILAKCIQMAVYLFLYKVGTAGGPRLQSTADQLIPWVRATIGDIMKMARTTNFQTSKSTNWWRTTEVPGAMSAWLKQFKEFAGKTRLHNSDYAYKGAKALALYSFISIILKGAQELGRSTVDPIPLAHVLRTQFCSEVKTLTGGPVIAGRGEVDAPTGGPVIAGRGEVDARTGGPFPWSILSSKAIGRFVANCGGDGEGTRQALIKRATILGFDQSRGICNFQQENIESLEPTD